MSDKIFGPVRGLSIIILTVINTFFWLMPILPFAFLKFVVKKIVPIASVQKISNTALNWLCTRWANCNRMILNLLRTTSWDIECEADLNMDKWYLVLSNHQSWADIVVLQYVLNDRIPYFRFFLKKQLMWFPVFNLVWWALDYPVMERYSKEFIEKNPHLKGKDIETTKKSCKRFKDTPVSIMNFVEGTRFTKSKHEKQNSHLKHLLLPKAGGTAFVLEALEGQISAILDVTIIYTGGALGIWNFFCGRVPEVKVRIRELPITDDVIGDYFEDEEYKARFQKWINNLWEEKDELIDKTLAE